jgi:hypothetical protein
MSISSVTSKVIYVGTGSTAASAKVFAYPFRILAEADLVVSEYATLTSSLTTKTLNSDYVVSGVGVSGGGNVTLTGSYTSLSTYSQLVIQRVMDLTQETDYVANDAFPAETHEQALDKLTMITQQLQEQLDRAVLAEVTQTTTSISYIISTVNTNAQAAASSAAVAVSSVDAAASSAAVAVSSAAVAVASTARFLRVTLVDPYSIYTKTPTVCLLESLNSAITISNLQVTCDADPTTEIAGDIKYANTFIGTASPTLISAFDTTAGILRSTMSVSVAAGKCIYMAFDSQPSTAITQVNLNLRYQYD